MKPTRLLDTIKKIISDNNLEVEAITEYPTSNNAGVGIEKGNNEGYYVVIRDGGFTEYALRIHSRIEALKALGVMAATVE